MQTTVIYHRADYDGIFCYQIAKKFLGEEGVNYVGWDFGDTPLCCGNMGTGDADDKYVVMDLPLDKPFGLNFVDGWHVVNGKRCQELSKANWHKFIWIDHHKSAIESHPKDIPGYRIDGVAACRLAWQWFRKRGSNDVPPDWHRETMPCKQDFIDRSVSEPVAVRLAGEYDIWDKRDPRSETFQYALRTYDMTDTEWQRLLRNEASSENMVGEMLPIGLAAQKYQQRVDADIATHRSFDLKWNGLNFMTINAVRCNSLTFESAVRPDHDALLGFYWNGKTWIVSMYHAPHRKDIDLSKIAVANGGGGHRGACGFQCQTLPFELK